MRITTPLGSALLLFASTLCAIAAPVLDELALRDKCGEESFSQVEFQQCLKKEAEKSEQNLERTEKEVRDILSKRDELEVFARVAQNNFEVSNIEFAKYRTAQCKYMGSLLGGIGTAKGRYACMAELNNRRAVELRKSASLLYLKGQEEEPSPQPEEIEPQSQATGDQKSSEMTEIPVLGELALRNKCSEDVHVQEECLEKEAKESEENLKRAEEEVLDTFFKWDMWEGYIQIAKDNLAVSTKEFIWYRKAQCEYMGSLLGGSLTGVGRLACEAELNNRRASQLRKRASLLYLKGQDLGPPFQSVPEAPIETP